MRALPKKFQPLIYILLFFVSWQFLQLYNYAYAFDNAPARVQAVNPWQKLNQILDQNAQTLAQLVELLDAGYDISEPWGWDL